MTQSKVHAANLMQVRGLCIYLKKMLIDWLPNNKFDALFGD